MKRIWAFFVRLRHGFAKQKGSVETDKQKSHPMKQYGGYLTITQIIGLSRRVKRKIRFALANLPYLSFLKIQSVKSPIISSALCSIDKAGKSIDEVLDSRNQMEISIYALYKHWLFLLDGKAPTQKEWERLNSMINILLRHDYNNRVKPYLEQNS